MSLDTREYTAEMFSGEQITEAIGALPDDNRYADVSRLSGSDMDFDPDVIEAFAKLARSLHLPIRLQYGGLVIRRERPLHELRRQALYELQRKAERGEIEPAYLHGRPGDEA
jgi:hypothetical protein